MDASLHQDFQDLLTRFKEDENKWEQHTKAEYIKRCDELVTAQVEAGVIEIETEGICTYLYKKLTDFGIQISERTIQRNVPETHKRNYSESDTLSQLEEDKWNIIETADESEVIEKNQYGDYKINGKEVKVKEVKPPLEPKEPKKPIDKDTDQCKYLAAMMKLSNKFHLTLDSLKDRYNKDNEAQKLIDEILGDCKEKLEQYAKDWANIETSKGMIDLRRHYGEYEKVMARFMMNTGETIARIAQLMTYEDTKGKLRNYSEKYGSIGIDREPQVVAFFESEETFPLYLRTCPSCLADIAMEMNKNISYWRECNELGIEFVPIDISIPVIKYN